MWLSSISRRGTRALGLVTTLLVTLSLAGLAHADSQQGGVPSLENRVAALEAIVTTLQASSSNQIQQISALQAQVASLQGQVVQQTNQVVTLQTNIATLQAALTSATLTLGCMSKVGTEVFFDGCNVHIRSGGGSTDAPVNGLGNLIVGYNEIQYGEIFRTGSHNLVVGRNNSYTSYGGFVAGELNAVSAPAASVSGGFQNSATGMYSSVSGGGENVASNDRSVVSGGTFNHATGSGATVSGGGFNTASAIYSSVSGGYTNQASGTAATVSGGAGRTATGLDNWAAGTLFEQF
jgi:hypothetical protein